MNQYRADVYSNDRLVNTRYYQAADQDVALNIARTEARQSGRTHADVYEGDDLGRATYVDTVHGDLGGAR